MAPGLLPDDIVLAWSRRPAAGVLVVARQAGREVIKRVRAVRGDQVYLTGDNPEHSSDSRHHGWVKNSDILGVVMMRFRFAQAVDPPRPVPLALMVVPYTLALYTAAALVYQLMNMSNTVFTAEIITGGNRLLAQFLVIAILLLQLLALPFWLRLRLSQLMRALSALSGLIWYGALFLLSLSFPLRLVPTLVLGPIILIGGFNAYFIIGFTILFAAAVCSYYVLGGRKILDGLKNQPS